MSFKRVAGHNLEYAWIGPSADEAPTLVFLHEGLGSLSLWRDFPAALCARTGCGGLVYSRWGHGASDPLNVPHSVKFMHDEALVVLPELVAAFGIRRPVLVGHSDGASIALIYSGSGTGETAGLILEAPHVFVEDLTVQSIARTRDRYDTSDLRARLGRHHANVDRLFAAWTDVWLSPEFRDWNIENYLPGIHSPTIVIQGLDDEYGTPLQVDAMTTALGNRCETLLLADCGHTPHVDRRAAVETAMAGFVERLVNNQRV